MDPRLIHLKSRSTLEQQYQPAKKVSDYHNFTCLRLRLPLPLRRHLPLSLKPLERVEPQTSVRAAIHSTSPSHSLPHENAVCPNSADQHCFRKVPSSMSLDFRTSDPNQVLVDHKHFFHPRLSIFMSCDQSTSSGLLMIRSDIHVSVDKAALTSQVA